MPAFTIEQLEEHKLLDAWPILRLAGGDALPEWWKNEAGELMSRGGGVLAARAPDGALHGVATYECVHRPRGAPVLAVERLVTFELNRNEPVKQALCRALREIASAFCCSAIAFPVTTIKHSRQRARAMSEKAPRLTG